MTELLSQLDTAGIRLYVADGKLRANVPGNKIPADLKRQISENKGQIIQWLLADAESLAGGNSASPAKDELFKLSFAQQRLWFEDFLAQGAAHYNIQFSEMLHGQFKAQAFKQALRQLIERHQILRSCYRQVKGECFQNVISNFDLPYEISDLSELTDEQQNGHCESAIKAQKNQAFVLRDQLPLRVKLMVLSSDKTLCIITIHHIACDGWSVALLKNELRALYQANKAYTTAQLPSLSIQYKDYAYWQRSEAVEVIKAQQLAYWQQQLAAIPVCHQLPLDFVRPKSQSFEGSGLQKVYQGNTVKRLRLVCERYQVTPFMLLYTVFVLVLNRFSASTDIVVGTPVSGRIKKELEPLIGCFVNSLVLRTRLDQNASIVQQLNNNKGTILDAFDNQLIPYEMLVETLAPPRDPRFGALFQVFFSLQNKQTMAGDKAPSGSKPERTSGSQPIDNVSSKADLELHVIDGHAEIACNWVYCSALFRSETITSMVNSFDCLLDSVLKNLEAGQGVLLRQLPSVRPSDINTLFEDQHSTEANGEAFKYLHSSVEAYAQRTPDAIAVSDSRKTLSYHALNCRANQLARVLKNQGFGAEDLVGILLSRSVYAFVSMVAVLKSGAAFLPLDPRSPSQRLQEILESSQCKRLLTDDNTKRCCEFEHRYCLDDPANIRLIDAQSVQNLAAGEGPQHPENIAYSIFTSGTTGAPKGVLLTHKGMNNLGKAQKQAFDLSANSRVMQFASFGFDAVVWDLVMAFSNGAALYVLNEQQVASVDLLIQAAKQQYITHTMLPPALLSAFDQQALATHLPHLIVGGEALPQETAQIWQQGRCFYNAYGPTETSVCATIAAYKGGAVTIGKSILNLQCYVLDESQNLLPNGAIGELCIGGPSLARGYLQKPGLTADKFIPSPFSHQPGMRLYRTGDKARRLPNGEFEFLGRIDKQVKLRGHRIELQEIEMQLLQHPKVTQASVNLNKKALNHGLHGQDELVAFIICAPPESEHSVAEQEVDTVTSIKQHLQQHLPQYMVPEQMVVVDALPLNNNGKIDVELLLADLTQVDAQYQPPETDIEKSLSVIWQRLLSTQEIGRLDDFFECGGHSLLAMKLLDAIAQAFSVRLPVSCIFQTSTLESMARLIADENQLQKQSKQAQSDWMISLGQNKHLPSIYCLPGIAMFPSKFGPLQQALFDHCNLQVLFTPEFTEADQKILNLEGIVAHMCKIIMKNHQQGPVHVLGHSFGGCIAYEISCQLKNSDIEVKLLLLDCFFDFFNDNNLLQLGDELKQYKDSTSISVPALMKTTADINKPDGAGCAVEAIIRQQLQLWRDYSLIGLYKGTTQVLFVKDGLCGNDGVLSEIQAIYKTFLLGDMHFQLVEGDHTSVLQPPHVRGLADALSSWLNNNNPLTLKQRR